MREIAVPRLQVPWAPLQAQSIQLLMACLDWSMHFVLEPESWFAEL